MPSPATGIHACLRRLRRCLELLRHRLKLPASCSCGVGGCSCGIGGGRIVGGGRIDSRGVVKGIDGCAMGVDDIKSLRCHASELDRLSADRLALPCACLCLSQQKNLRGAHLNSTLQPSRAHWTKESSVERDEAAMSFVETAVCFANGSFYFAV